MSESLDLLLSSVETMLTASLPSILLLPCLLASESKYADMPSICDEPSSDVEKFLSSVLGVVTLSIIQIQNVLMSLAGMYKLR